MKLLKKKLFLQGGPPTQKTLQNIYLSQKMKIFSVPLPATPILDSKLLSQTESPHPIVLLLKL